VTKPMRSMKIPKYCKGQTEGATMPNNKCQFRNFACGVSSGEAGAKYEVVAVETVSNKGENMTWQMSPVLKFV